MTGTEDQNAKDRLLLILKERGILLGNDDVAWAFASPKTRDEMISWVNEYLQDENLLSKDEISLHKETTASRKASDELDDTAILQDHQLNEALESLRTSTNLIEQHTRALEKQRDALEALQRENVEHLRKSSSNSPGRTRHGENGTYTFMADETALAVQEDFAAAYKQSNKATTAIVSLTTERLGADDEVLGALSKLAARAMPHSKDGTTLGKIETWTKALSVMREQEANARIDTMIDQNILELLSTEQETPTLGEPAHPDDIESELKSLRDEIGSVVELVVGSEFRQPLSRLLRSSKSKSRTSQHEWLGYILATMEHMIRQVDEMGNCAEDVQSYNDTLAEIRTAYTSAIGANVCINQEGSQLYGDAQVRAAQLGSRPTIATAYASTNTNLAEQVFRRFAMTGRTDTAALETASEVATSKLKAQYTSIASSTADIVSKSMEEQRKEMQLVLKQLYAYSDFASVKLLPRELEDAVQGLDDVIGETVLTLSNAEQGKHEDVRRGIAKLQDRLNKN